MTLQKTSFGSSFVLKNEDASVLSVIIKLDGLLATRLHFLKCSFGQVPLQLSWPVQLQNPLLLTVPKPATFYSTFKKGRNTLKFSYIFGNICLGCSQDSRHSLSNLSNGIALDWQSLNLHSWLSSFHSQTTAQVHKTHGQLALDHSSSWWHLLFRFPKGD